MTIDEIANLKIGTKIVFKSAFSYRGSEIHVGTLFRLEKVIRRDKGEIYKFTVMTRRCKNQSCVYCNNGVYLSDKTKSSIISAIRAVDV